ncbi:MAG: class I tRNA ligase family protein, partial [Pirellulales bacterium]|nr:class I tRNA ligase family protein [Pirellulales bacterium]
PPELPGWESPWGRGRPGWHIECSAMSAEHLGETFDIHGGGLDLVFPHHENEIAQSRCAHGTAMMAKVWMHNGYVVVNGEKMSKSLGNFFTVRQLLEEGLDGEAIRLALLSAHYRAPLDITREKISECKTQLNRLYGALRGTSIEELDFSNIVSKDDPVENALKDDLNTPNAIHFLHLKARTVNTTKDTALKAHHKRSLRRSAWLLGLLQEDPEDWFKGRTVASGTLQASPATVEGSATFGASAPVIVSDEKIREMIVARTEARKAKNFAEADRIRNELKAQGILLDDGPAGTTWKRAD